MDPKKLISLGGSSGKMLNYDELKRALNESEIQDKKLRDNILEQYFPDRFFAEEKAHALESARRRWAACFQHQDHFLQPYRYDFGSVLKRAQRQGVNKRKNQPQNRVTDFFGWIFQLIYGVSDSANLREGKLVERIVQKIKIPLTSNDSDWEWFYGDPLSAKPEPLKISLLTVKDSPMYGAPDYVFINKKTETALIVEVKVSSAELPSDGWPNLRAQLWAYGYIDAIQHVKNIILIGEVWVRIDGNMVRRRRTYRWSLDDPQFCKENEQLFALYQQYASS